ncbi:MAG: macro domain-containing protein [Verrucomicrobiota bacterium]
MITGVTLTRSHLQSLKVDAIGYGAKDTGEMGGGAAAAVLIAAGPEILTDLRSHLAHSPSRRVGDVAVTSAFKLETSGIRWVLHIISIIKNTPQGAYCPEPERLRDGTLSALEKAFELGARSVGFSALATGEGRVEPRHSARYMLDGVKAFRHSHKESNLAVIFSLPSFRDFEAFSSAIEYQ